MFKNIFPLSVENQFKSNWTMAHQLKILIKWHSLSELTNIATNTIYIKWKMKVVNPICMMVPNAEVLTMMFLCFLMVSERYKLLQVRIVDILLFHIKNENISLIDCLIHSYNGVPIKVFLVSFLISFLCLSYLISASGEIPVMRVQPYKRTNKYTHKYTQSSDFH